MNARTRMAKSRFDTAHGYGHARMRTLVVGHGHARWHTRTLARLAGTPWRDTCRPCARVTIYLGMDGSRYLNFNW